MSQNVERRPASSVNGRTPACMNRGRRGIPSGICTAYGLVAAIGLWLLLSGTTPRPNFGSAQAVVQVLGSFLLLILGTGAGLGLCRVRAVRYACTLTGAGLMLSPLFLPGSFPPTVILGALAAFVASGWASDALGL
jgi:hypothetical protein